MKFLVSEAGFHDQLCRKLLISQEEPEQIGHRYLSHTIYQTKPLALPSRLNDVACMLSKVTDHVAAGNLTSSDEQYVREALTPPIGLILVGTNEHR